MLIVWILLGILGATTIGVGGYYLYKNSGSYGSQSNGNTPSKIDIFKEKANIIADEVEKRIDKKLTPDEKTKKEIVDEVKKTLEPYNGAVKNINDQVANQNQIIEKLNTEAKLSIKHTFGKGIRYDELKKELSQFDEKISFNTGNLKQVFINNIENEVKQKNKEDTDTDTDDMVTNIALILISISKLDFEKKEKIQSALHNILQKVKDDTNNVLNGSKLDSVKYNNAPNDKNDSLIIKRNNQYTNANILFGAIYSSLNGDICESIKQISEFIANVAIDRKSERFGCFLNDDCIDEMKDNLNKEINNIDDKEIDDDTKQLFTNLFEECAKAMKLQKELKVDWGNMGILCQKDNIEQSINKEGLKTFQYIKEQEEKLNNQINNIQKLKEQNGCSDFVSSLKGIFTSVYSYSKYNFYKEEDDMKKKAKNYDDALKKLINDEDGMNIKQKIKILKDFDLLVEDFNEDSKTLKMESFKKIDEVSKNNNVGLLSDMFDNLSQYKKTKEEFEKIKNELNVDGSAIFV